MGRGGAGDDGGGNKNPRDDERRGDDGRTASFSHERSDGRRRRGRGKFAESRRAGDEGSRSGRGDAPALASPGCMPGIMVGMGLAVGEPAAPTPAAWFIVIFRSKSIDATRGIPAAAAAASPVSAPLFAVAAACAAAARFCCDPTCAMLLKNCSNSACEGVRPRRHRLPTISSTLAVRSIGERCVRFFRTTTTTRERARTHTRRSRPHRARRDATRARGPTRGDSGGVSKVARRVPTRRTRVVRARIRARAGGEVQAAGADGVSSDKVPQGGSVLTSHTSVRDGRRGLTRRLVRSFPSRAIPGSGTVPTRSKGRAETGPGKKKEESIGRRRSVMTVKPDALWEKAREIDRPVRHPEISPMRESIPSGRRGERLSMTLLNADEKTTSAQGYRASSHHRLASSRRLRRRCCRASSPRPARLALPRRRGRARRGRASPARSVVLVLVRVAERCRSSRRRRARAARTTR